MPFDAYYRRAPALHIEVDETVIASAEVAAIKVLHVITGLGVGGAETMLVRLVSRLQDSAIENRVVALRSLRDLQPAIERAGAAVTIARYDKPHQVRRLTEAVDSHAPWAPNVIQGWMYHGNLAALYARRKLGAGAVIWNVRQGLYDTNNEKLLTRLAIRAGAWASRRPELILYNSHVGREQHEHAGYWHERARVIPNGVDATVFAPDRGARDRVRAELFGVQDDTPCIGMVARLNHLKGHRFFLEAAERVLARGLRARFVVVGRDCSWNQRPFSAFSENATVRGAVILLPERSAIAEIYSGLDLFCLPSIGEGFPNALAEAMSAAVPVIASAVGDCPHIVADARDLVQPADSGLLANRIAEVLTLPAQERQRIGAANRQRVLDHFSLDSVAQSYADLYRVYGRSAAA
jgi:glycosyltransferase involved in cell wall biosynthesis